MIFTCIAVFCTNSSSPSRLASSNRANGSKLTRRVNFVLLLSFEVRGRRNTLVVVVAVVVIVGADIDGDIDVVLSADVIDEFVDLSVSSLLLLLSPLPLLVELPLGDNCFTSVGTVIGCAVVAVATLIFDLVPMFVDLLVASDFSAAFSISGKKNAGGISMRRDVYCTGFKPDEFERNFGCSDIGCLRMVNGFALIGKLSTFNEAATTET